ncbi:glycosyltransferase family 2 protein [Vibrio owensii]|uniref:glycosyltransferase family 2 protein n=1 Tax=Vibrio owensii TaxID=696485 RepID=UPI0018F17401|nr:glycosyltransferase family 2 protein [Vibrio owensii]
MNPLVSVIIPTLNRSDLLSQAIKSVECQTYKNIEIIIIDDCSDDIVFASSDIHPLTVYRNSKRMGGAYSRNKGVSLSKGHYVCFLDDDDIYMPDKISFLLKSFNKYKSASAIFGLVIKKGDVINNRNKNKYLSDGQKVTSVGAIGGLHTNGSLIKREIFDDISFLTKLRKYQDTQLHFELIKSKSVIFCDFIVSEWNYEHEQGQVTDTKTLHQHSNGIKNFIAFEDYIKEKYELSAYERWYFRKRKVYLLAKAKIHFNDFKSPMKLSFSEYVMMKVFWAYFRFIK